MQKWPFFNNKPKVQPEQQSAEKPKPEAPQQIAPAQQSKPNNIMPAAQQKPSPSQQGVSNAGKKPNMTMPAVQQKPNQQGVSNAGTANAGLANTGKPNMTMPAVQQKPNQQGVSNMGTSNTGTANTGKPNMAMPAAQQKPNQQGVSNAGTANMGTANAGMANMGTENAGMPNMNMPASKEMPAQMTLPTVPAPKDNSKFMVSMNNKGHHKSNQAGQQMNNANMMGQQMNNANTMGQQISNANAMGQQMENSNVMAGHTGGKPEKGQNLQDDADIQVPLSEALNLIKNAVEGETEDRLFYEYLINNASSRKDKEIIKGIRDDEIKHAKLFRQLYYEHTGKIIGPDKNVSFEKPASYCDGLIKALMGEQNAVRKYRKILFAMKERSHINTLTEIITDEIRHGSLYNLLIHNNDCKY